MSIGLGILTLIFLLATAVMIYIKKKKFRNVILNLVLFIVSGIALWIGNGAIQGWLILLCGIVIGGCLLTSAIHAYNQLFTSGKEYHSVGEDRKPKSFGNGYWH